VLYLVMELLQGRTLRDAMARGDLTHPEIRRIMMELLDALAAAHVRGFVHRDLKPENVFLAGPTGTVKLLDFGIAKVLDAGLANVRTALGVTMGTPAYMAPEQVNNASGVDARADLWAAGVMIYEMLCGKLPFVGATTGAFLLAITTQEPTPIRAYLPTATPAHEAFFSRALARELFRRFPSALEMGQAFTALALPLGLAEPATPVSGHGATVATGPGIPANPTGVAALGFDATHTPQHAAQTPMPVAAGRLPGGHSGQTPMPVAHAPHAAAQAPMAMDTRAPQMPAPVAAYATGPVPPAQTPMPIGHAPQVAGHGGPPQMPAPATSYPAGATMPVAPPAAAPRASSGLILGGLGGLAFAAAIAIVLISRCGGGGDKSVAKQGSAAPIDAAVVAVVIDAPVAVPPPVDAAVVAVADAAPPPADAAVKPKRRDAAVASVPSRDAAVAKVVPKVSPCAPKGTASCIRAMKCQNSCEDDDDACRCQCRATVDPSHAPALDAFAACAKNCGWRNMCELRRCTGKAAACARE
jgi:serine/threonine-protein kinase